MFNVCGPLSQLMLAGSKLDIVRHHEYVNAASKWAKSQRIVNELQFVDVLLEENFHNKAMSLVRLFKWDMTHKCDHCLKWQPFLGGVIL